MAKKKKDKNETIEGRNGGTLKPFKKGFDERRNTNGSKPSMVNKIAKRLFGGEEYVTLSNVEEVEEGGVPTGRKVNVRVKFDSADVVVMHYLRRAKKSDRVLIDLIDRIDGKASQSLVLGGMGEDGEIKTKVTINLVDDEQGSS